MLTNNTRKYHLGFRAIWPKAMHVSLLPYCAWFMKMFTGARRKKTKREMDWQLVACYFTVKSKDIFCNARRPVHRKKQLVKLTHTSSFCLQKRTFLKTKWLLVRMTNYFFQCTAAMDTSLSLWEWEHNNNALVIANVCMIVRGCTYRMYLLKDKLMIPPITLKDPD